ncbi:MAG: FHA domain-containing protein [Acidimicrobiales bacterium]
MSLDDYAANVVPGIGAVARWEAGVLIAGGPQDVALDLIADVTTRLGDDPTSAALIGLLRDGPRFDGADVDLAAAVSIPDGVRVFVRGDMQIRTETDESILGPEPAERDLSAVALWLGRADPPTVQGHPIMDFRRGVVTGSGIVIHRPAVVEESESPVPKTPRYPDPAPHPDPAPAQPAAVAPTPPQPGGAESPATVRPFDAIEWDLPSAVETREPLAVLTNDTDPTDVEAGSEAGQQVLGIRCSRGHFNNPQAGYCQVCGISMIHLTHRLEPGVRPTLGFVVFADGATYALDRPYLIGRRPVPGPDSGMTALATQDATQSVSREHAELRIEEWDVEYVDLGSTNGSFIWNTVAGRWDPIPAGTSVTLESGTTVSVGRMTFVFEGASRAVGAA